MYPRAVEQSGARTFEKDMLARLGKAENPHSGFQNEGEYAAFLDHLERVTLPAIEAAEAGMPQRCG